MFLSKLIPICSQISFLPNFILTGHFILQTSLTATYIYIFTQLSGACIVLQLIEVGTQQMCLFKLCGVFFLTVNRVTKVQTIQVGTYNTHIQGRLFIIRPFSKLTYRTIGWILFLVQIKNIYICVDAVHTILIKNLCLIFK